MTTNATSSSHRFAAGNRKSTTCVRDDSQPNDLTAIASWSLFALLVAPLGTRSARWPRPPPAGSQNQRHLPLLLVCGAERLQLHRNSVSCFVHRLSSSCQRRMRAWSTGSRRSCAVVGRWHLAPLLKACRSIAAVWITKLPLSPGASWARHGMCARRRRCSGACGLGPLEQKARARA